MDRYFARHYDGPGFELFSLGHWLAIGVITTIVVFLIWGWRDPDESSRRRARFLIAGIMILNEIGWHTWNIVHGAWSVQEHLPLHATSLSIWGSIFVLITRNYRVYEVVFFIGIVGLVAVVIISWVYEMTPEGIRKESEIDCSQSITPQTGRKLDRLIIGVLVVAVGILLVNRSPAR